MKVHFFQDEESLDRQYAIDKSTTSTRTYAAANPPSGPASVGSREDARSRRSSIDSTDSTDAPASSKDLKVSSVVFLL